MEDSEQIVWLPLERAKALEILQEQIAAGDTWLKMADELSPGIASKVEDFYNAKEDFRLNNSDLKALVENDDITDRETDKNTYDRMNSLDWMVSSLKTWDARWPPEASTKKQAFWQATDALKNLIWENLATVRSGMQESASTTTATQA